MSKDTSPSVHIMRSPLGRARGLGAAKSGAAHWWAERVTSVALLPLSLYFVVSVLILKGADHAAMAAYLGEPWNAVLFLLLIGTMFSHISMGLQVVIEDYVREEGKRLALLLVVKGGVWFLALAAAVSVLKLAFS
ncbi:succinate dehydrogenase, hydrophobic membrane anchor protein [Acidocella aromatica]|uniref:Succinate dehydrogenase hydrophobic membrane anchor subunit n=1 Tax=Acidocella aromatica TaxID=1303579 RepID=A0A840V8Y3_9PROT|nr:succinate dehydrogenase, hydrophobic membrane anchor protein [Acidocella aromatica]MBB5371944.1 succinate dehydrogenase / fumarate reductase membrane anchor subunit [Acidocella aromatica]